MKKDKAKEFLKKHCMDVSDVDVENVLTDFQTEMENGLAGRESSLAMIPTFITVGKPVPVDRPVIVIDAGGTNLRVATVVFDQSGKAEIVDPVVHQMPGIDSELTGEEFFNQLAGFLSSIIDKSDRIGFCFSYPAEISPERDGKLLMWTKEVKVPDAVGQYMGKGLLDALGGKGADKKITLLNDTITTLLAGKSAGKGVEYHSYIGFILGTGTNTAYVEQNSKITKLNGLDPGGAQAINVESGNFNCCRRGSIDLEFDRITEQPGTQQFEKMISGGYLGGLCLQVIKTAAREDLFDQKSSETILSLDDLSTKQVSEFLSDFQKEGPLVQITSQDKETVNGLFSGIVERAALLTAINISAAVIKSGGGNDLSRPVCINVDGSTYYKLHGFESMVVKQLQGILGARGKSFELTCVENAPTIGAAVAGLTHGE